MTIYSDVNPRYGQSENPELLIDIAAINSSIENILGTLRGERLFLPQFGSGLLQYLFEPMNEETSEDILVIITDSVELWEPRVRVIRSESFVEPLYDENQYNVNVVYEVKATGRVAAFNRIIVRPS